MARMKVVAVDTETWGDVKKTGPHHPSIKLSHLSWWSGKKGGVYDVKEEGHHERIEKFADKVLRNPLIAKVFWNASFDVPVLKRYGIEIKGPILDAMIVGQTVFPDERSHSLKHFSRKFLNDRFIEEDEVKAYVRKNKCQYGDVPLKLMYPYALKDARNTYDLYTAMFERMSGMKMAMEGSIETVLLRTSLQMEEDGWRLDLDRVEELRQEATRQRDTLKRRVFKLAGREFNVNSPKQLAEILYEKHKPKRRTKKTQQPATDNLALLELGTPLALEVAQYRHLSKVVGTYYETLAKRADKLGFIHPSWNQNQAITGRYSCSNPNLQNNPRPDEAKGIAARVRECFVARDRDHRLVCIDYSQIELRFTAILSGEEHMLQAYLNEEDIHGNTCKRVFQIDEDERKWDVMRYIAKTINFLVLYGGGPDRLRETVLKDTLGEVRLTRSEAKRHIERWKASHPAVMSLLDRLYSEIARTGGIRTYYGRYIPVESGHSYASLNYLIQGTAAGFLKRVMIDVSSLLSQARTRLVGQVHAELIFDMPLSERAILGRLVALMEDRENFPIPLTCEASVGFRWSERRKVSRSQLARLQTAR